MNLGRVEGEIIMRLSKIARKIYFRKAVVLAIVVSAYSFALSAGRAESPNDPKQVAFEAVDRNAEQIALVGDVLYYFGEPGMQEHESAKILKKTLEGVGITVEDDLGGDGLGDLAYWVAM